MDTMTSAIEPRSWARSQGQTDTARGARSDARATDVETIRRGLGDVVVGQTDAVRELSLVLAMHAHADGGRRGLNAIIIGPTGVGKTHTLTSASQLLGLPFVVTDATSLVPAGIVGEQVEDVVEALVRRADGILAEARVPRRRDDDLDLASRGVILFDEFDKLAVPEDMPPSTSSDRRSIQRRLLKLAEGARVRVGVKHHEPAIRDRHIDTGGILLLASGVFDGLAGPGWHGFGRKPRDRKLEPGDIVGAGFLPELVGRLPLTITFAPLTAADLVAIIDHDDVSPLAAWQRYLGPALGTDLRLDEAAKWVVAQRAEALGMGARGLQHVLFPVIAERIRDIASGASKRDIRLRAADFMPQATLSMATRVQ